MTWLCAACSHVSISVFERTVIHTDMGDKKLTFTRVVTVGLRFSRLYKTLSLFELSMTMSIHLQVSSTVALSGYVVSKC